MTTFAVPATGDACLFSTAVSLKQGPLPRPACVSRPTTANMSCDEIAQEVKPLAQADNDLAVSLNKVPKIMD